MHFGKSGSCAKYITTSPQDVKIPATEIAQETQEDDSIPWDGNESSDEEFNVEAVDNNIIVSFEQVS